MKEKIEKLLGKFKSSNFLFTSATETFYLTGAHFDGFWAVFVKDEVYIICSRMIENQVRQYFDFLGSKVQVLIAKGSYIDIIASILKRNRENSLIADSLYISAEVYLKITEKFNAENLIFYAKAGILDEIRQVKSDEEIEKIRNACRIVSKTADMVRNEIRVGISEMDIHCRILEIFAQNGVNESFTPIVAAGVNSSNPHHCSSNYKIKENDIVLMDLGCYYQGYASDLTRTYYFGKTNYKINAILDLARTAQRKIIDNIRAGLPISWADKTARLEIDKYGYADNFIHNVGHSIGIGVHESPTLSSEAEGKFLNRMVLAIEPGIYFENQFGVRTEDTVLIKQDGCEVLTNAQY